MNRVGSLCSHIHKIKWYCEWFCPNRRGRIEFVIFVAPNEAIQWTMVRWTMVTFKGLFEKTIQSISGGSNERLDDWVDDSRNDWKNEKKIRRTIGSERVRGKRNPTTTSVFLLKDFQSKRCRNTFKSVTSWLAESCAALSNVYKNKWNSMEMAC